MKNLDIKTIPLTGRHIIEASAGTGKTYNITELYIRLLLEKRLLPSQILVMTFTKDATQEIIGRVESKLREKLASYTPEQKEEQKSDYLHLKRASLEIDEAAIFTIHGFCKKILSEQAFASGMEMDISMEVDTSDILQKIVEDFFRKNINNNKTNYEYLKLYSLHTPERFLDRDGLASVIKSNYQIIADQTISFDEFILQKKYQLEILTKNQSIVDEFLSKVGKGEPQGKRVDEYSKVLKWLELPSDVPFPDCISIITNGNKIKGAKIKPLFKGIKELKELLLEIKQREAAQFIQEVCLQIRKNFIITKQDKAVLDFDDLIAKLCNSVKSSTDLIRTLQTQYPVALIDEFQDTDAQQYEILDMIYPVINTNLLFIMIGDPKQAIYGFRGGDIFIYLRAKQSCSYENQWSMDTNWRSTYEMIKAYNRLFYKSNYKYEGEIAKNIFGEGIDYQTVKASAYTEAKQREFKDNLKPINYFYYEASKDDKKGDIDKKLSYWVANETVRVLNSKSIVEDEIAILVENSKQANIIQQALSTKGLSSVYLSQRDNVFQSQEAIEILNLMEGVNELENKALLKKALATSLLGSTAKDFVEFLDEDDVSAWDDKIEQVKVLRAQWQNYGFMMMMMQVIHQNFNLRANNKERVITNILHLVELIKVAESKYKHPNQLIKWYRQQIVNNSNAEGELRLESDDSLIKIITIHGSKGLEFPVIFVPFASYVSTSKFNLNKVNKYYDSLKKQAVYKIGRCDTTKQIIEQETMQELMRLFYVAITRAEHRCYIGVAKYSNSEKSPLAQFLNYQKTDNWLDKIEMITNDQVNQSQIIKINDFQSISLAIKINEEISRQDLLANDIRDLKNDNWEMLSFSKISKSKFQNTALDKENDETDDITSNQKLNSKLEFRFTAPRGADTGNILHNVLEHTDFSTGEIDDVLLREQVNRYKVVAAEDFDKLKEWLVECLSSDIFEINTNNRFCLKDLLNSKTLKEAEFYFPIMNEKLYKAAILKVLNEYRGIFSQLGLASELLDYTRFDNYKILGMLHGFIDLIFEYNGKFYVADYKSNYLGEKVGNYNQQTMRIKNQNSLYDLQYLIYSVALNKYLKQNIPDYNFDTHFGGVYYFYLRGMKSGYGVYQAKPPYRIIKKLSMLFDGADNDI